MDDMTREEKQTTLMEVRVLAMLNHPNIIAYYDSFLEDKALMIVMEYAEGWSHCVLWYAAGVISHFEDHWQSSDILRNDSQPISEVMKTPCDFVDDERSIFNFFFLDER